MIVFLISGLWHGANWTYVVWGGLNGLMQIIGDILMPLRKKVWKKARVDTKSFGFKLLQGIITFILVDFAWTFFRATSIQEAFEIIRSSFAVFNPWVLFDGTLYTLGLSKVEFWVMVMSILVLLGVDILHVKGISIRESVLKQPLVIRWGLYYTAILAILIFGVYGPGYNAANFIYFQF